MGVRSIIALLLLTAGCASEEPISQPDDLSPRSNQMTGHHPIVDFEHWASVFPIETFEKTTGPRQFSTNEKGDPLDLWKAGGDIITSPAHLCNVELVRKQYAQTRDLGRAVPVDIFLWSINPAPQPYLTRLGGTPHREVTKPWPKNASGTPYTFVAQFCFADSRDIVSARIPDDVMLIFFKDADSAYDTDGIHVEWSSIELNSPLHADQCPAPAFVVPQLSGHIYRTLEYPDSVEVFEKEGHDQCYLFPTTQSTKIGRETFYIQGDVREPGEELICALNSVHPTNYPPKAKWPFVDLDELPLDFDKPDDNYGWGKYYMMFGDVGCLYFVINDSGVVRWEMEFY